MVNIIIVIMGLNLGGVFDGEEDFENDGEMLDEEGDGSFFGFGDCKLMEGIMLELRWSCDLMIEDICFMLVQINVEGNCVDEILLGMIKCWKLYEQIDFGKVVIEDVCGLQDLIVIIGLFDIILYVFELILFL